MKGNQAQEEFEQFVAGSADDLLRTAHAIVWDLTTAEDLVQECLLRTARRWPRVRSMEYPLAYARRILVNLALDGAPRRHRQNSELDPGTRLRLDERHDEAAARAFGTVDSASVVLAALGGLAPRQRAVLVLRYLEDLSEAQVAETLGCSVGNVKSTAWRALERLRLVLDPDRSGDTGPFGHASHDTNGANHDERATRI